MALYIPVMHTIYSSTSLQHAWILGALVKPIIRLASSGKSTSFLCYPFCEVGEKMHPWKLLKVVVCVPQAVTCSLLFCGFSPKSKTNGRDSIVHHREDQPSCNRDCLQRFCLSDLVGGWGLILIPLNFMCPELVARCLRVT